MTLQLEWPETFFRLAGQYSGYWDVRAQLWWARRAMDSVTWRARRATVPVPPVDSQMIRKLAGLATVQYGHRPEVEVIVPRYDAYVAEMQRQVEAGYEVSWDMPRVDYDLLNSIGDWLASLDERMLGKIWKLSWAQGVEHAAKWHAALAKAAEDKSAGETDISHRIDSLDGWTWCRLGSVWAMDREGAVMGHCVGQGGYDGYADIQSDTAGIWSLRDDNGRSHVTIEVGGYGHQGAEPALRLIQAKGPKNRPLNDDERVHLALFTDAMGIDTSKLSFAEFAQREFQRLRAYLEAEQVAQRVGALVNELGDTMGRFVVTAGADIQARAIVNCQQGIAYEFDSQGGDRPDGSAIADAIVKTPRRQRLPPPTPHYRQHERRGRLHGRI